MKKLSLCFLASAIGMLLQFPCGAPAQSIGDELIFPDINRKFVIVQADRSSKDKLTGTEMPATDSLAALSMAEIQLPFNWQMVRVSQCARNLMKNTDGPNMLYLSKNEGGFPRSGIWLTDKTGKETHYPDLAFVDLALNANRINQGDMSIYTHELGHVMMGLVLDEAFQNTAFGHTAKQHVSMGVTDYLTAFNEGWGVHFQRLAYDHTEKYQKTFDDKLALNRSLNLVWHSGMDQYTRLMFVKNNEYIYEKFTQCGDPTVSQDLEQRILLEHTSPAFDHTCIKNAQQMLSCEGVLATIFYQVNSDPKLASNYQPAAFYSPFLLKSIPEGTAPQKIFTPTENIMLKNLWVMYQMRDKKLDESPILVWLKEWCTQFPNDRDQILKIFLQLTNGITVDAELANLAEKMNYSGQIGDMKTFQSLGGQYKEILMRQVADCKKDLNRLSTHVGPELWVTSTSVKIRQSLWMADPKNPLTVNLNTASLPEMEAFMDQAMAAQFIQKRRAIGFFTSMEQIKEFGYTIEGK